MTDTHCCVPPRRAEDKDPEAPRKTLKAAVRKSVVAGLVQQMVSSTQARRWGTGWTGGCDGQGVWGLGGWAAHCDG